MQQFLPDTTATERFGAELLAVLANKSLVFLQGELGAGKTTLVRGFLRAAGYEGTVKSPTYNIVEGYSLTERNIYHFDLYRINSPEELEWIGIDDYLNQEAICFIEWPDKGGSLMPKPDMTLVLTVKNDGRMVEIQKN